MARNRTIVDAELLGHGTPIGGRLDVGGGGAAFAASSATGGFVIAPEDLVRVGPATPGGDAIRPEATVRLTVEAPSARHVLRIDATATWDVAMALVSERSEAGLPEVHIETAGGAVLPARDHEAGEPRTPGHVDSAFMLFVPWI
jgi:hypothetical protein